MLRGASSPAPRHAVAIFVHLVNAADHSQRGQKNFKLQQLLWQHDVIYQNLIISLVLSETVQFHWRAVFESDCFHWSIGGRYLNLIAFIGPFGAPKSIVRMRNIARPRRMTCSPVERRRRQKKKKKPLKWSLQLPGHYDRLSSQIRLYPGSTWPSEHSLSISSLGKADYPICIDVILPSSYKYFILSAKPC